MGIKAAEQVTVTDITDAYSVTLTSEAYTFIGNTSGAPSGLSCTTQAVAYCGSTLCSNINITQANIVCPNGITATVTDNNTVSPTVKFTTTATITDSCEATIPVVVDGVTINKKFSFAVAKQGATGEKGDDGQTLFAKCSTPSSTISKTATLTNGSLSLTNGVTVSVRFTYANTASSPTLNINSTGPKYIRVGNSNISSEYYWGAYATVTFVYYGNYWYVADSDALSKSNEAAKTATNYLNFESDGLVLGDITKETLGNNVLIDSGSVNIREGSTKVATFSKDVIELGKNSESSKIKLCGNVGTIKCYNYDDSIDKFLNIDAESIALRTEKKLFLDVDYNNTFGGGINGIYTEDVLYPFEIGMMALNHTKGYTADIYARVSESSSMLELSSTDMLNNIHSYMYITQTGTRVNKPISINDIEYTGQNKLLWNGASLMGSDQTIYLSKKLSALPNGMVLMFSYYINSAPSNSTWHYFFVPKTSVNFNSGNTNDFNVGSINYGYSAMKRLFIGDDRIVGHSLNTTSGVAAGSINYYNNRFALRYVIGV